MSFKSIFVPMALEQTAVPTMDAGLLMAATFKGHVLAHHVRQRYLAYPPVDFYPASGAAAQVAMEGHDEATATFARTMRAVFDERCDKSGANIVPLSEALKQNGVTASWTEETGYLARDYSLAARIADLVVMALPEEKDVHLEREVLEAILIHSGAPLLMCSRDGLSVLPQRPLVAWDGSLQASRVVRSALPLLQMSKETTLLTIGDTDAGTPSLETAKLWLERSGVHVTSRVVDWPGGSIAERIMNQCDATNSDLIVLGGYSHSRLSEAVTGGVTLHMLRHADRSLLMVH